MADERVEINQGGASMTTPILTDAAAAEIKQRGRCTGRCLSDVAALLADRRALLAELAAVTAERDAGLVAFKATDDTANQWLERALAEKVRAAAAEAALAARDAEVDRLREAILWADGQRGEFPMRQAQGPFWWRKELMTRAALTQPPEPRP